MTHLHANRKLQQGPAGGRGFSLVEMLVAVAVIGTVSAIAMPNLCRALRTARRQAANESATVLAGAIEQYTAMNNVAPMVLDNETLEPLVSEGTLSGRDAEAIVANFDDAELLWYWAWDSGWWGQLYEIGYRPKGAENCMCWLSNMWAGCWYDDIGWVEFGK